MTITIKQKDLKDRIDAINGAVIAVSKSIENRNLEEYRANMDKLNRVVGNLLGICKVEQNNVDMFVSALQVRTMRFSKNEVKSLSGSMFRKWVKEWLFTTYDVTFESGAAKKGNTTSVRMTPEELQAYKAWLQECNK